MGIKKLSKYILEDNIIQTIDIQNLAYKRVAIDISILLYQIIISIRNSGDDLRNNKGEVTSHILGLFNKTVWLINNKIIPIFIFDGKPPEFKYGTIKNRKEIRMKAKEKLKLCTDEKEKIKYLKRSTYLTGIQIEQSKELLDLMGIPYLQAKGEADVLCAKLSEYNYVDYVFTEDMDILTFGASKIIKNLFGKSPIYVIDKLQVLKKYDVSYKQFIIFCIILGCDYHNINFKISKEEALEIAKEYKYFSDINYNCKKINSKLVESIFDYFYNQEHKIKNFNLEFPKPELLYILVKRYGLLKQKIFWKINLLNKNIFELKQFNF